MVQRAHRYVGLLETERRFVLPVEKDLRYIILDGQVERQGVLVDDAVPTIVEVAGYTCY